MKKFILILVALCLVLGVGSSFLIYKKKKYHRDLAVMGTVKFDDGIGRQTIGLIDCLRKDYSISYVKSGGGITTKDLPPAVKKIVKERASRTANVLIFEDPLLFPEKHFVSLPKAKIKIAYSMTESTKIPQNWVTILNYKFDAVVVPDQFLVDVYKNCGVKIPIFVVPLGMYLDPFLKDSFLHSKPVDRPFVFGNLGTFMPRKNQEVLIKAFAKAFGNDPKVQLFLNGRSGENDYLNLVQQTKSSLNLDNVTITSIPLEWKLYTQALASLDCYVSPSKGEGFSLQPREALALGIPSIVTDNTAQKTICDTGYVRVVPSSTPVKAYFRIFNAWHDDLGLQYECDVDALAESLRDVYENYESYAVRAHEARNWVEQYRYDRLHQFYKAIVLPKEVVLCERNAIENGVIYTTSANLKKSYDSVLAKQTPMRKLLNSLIIKLQ